MAGKIRAADEAVTQYLNNLNSQKQKLADLKRDLRAYQEAFEVAPGSAAKPIRVLIEQKETQISKQEDKTREAEIELRTARAMRDAVVGRDNIEQTEQQRTRRLSDKWIIILQFIHDAGPSGVSLEQIDSFIIEKGLNVRDSAVRAQLSIYSSEDKGYVASTGVGAYKITERGIAALLASIKD